VEQEKSYQDQQGGEAGSQSTSWWHILPQRLTPVMGPTDLLRAPKGIQKSLQLSIIKEARTEGYKNMGGRWRLQKHLRTKVLNRFISDVR
jgi:hypothetical protein